MKQTYRFESKFLGLGCLLLLLGFGAIFAMSIGLVAPSFLLSFAGYGVSLAGLTFGIMGAVHLYERSQ